MIFRVNKFIASSRIHCKHWNIKYEGKRSRLVSLVNVMINYLLNRPNIFFFISLPKHRSSTFHSDFVTFCHVRRCFLIIFSWNLGRPTQFLIQMAQILTKCFIISCNCSLEKLGHELIIITKIQGNCWTNAWQIDNRHRWSNEVNGPLRKPL